MIDTTYLYFGWALFFLVDTMIHPWLSNRLNLLGWRLRHFTEGATWLIIPISLLPAIVDDRTNFFTLGSVACIFSIGLVLSIRHILDAFSRIHHFTGKYTLAKVKVRLGFALVVMIRKQNGQVVQIPLSRSQFHSLQRRKTKVISLYYFPYTRETFKIDS